MFIIHVRYVSFSLIPPTLFTLCTSTQYNGKRHTIFHFSRGKCKEISLNFVCMQNALNSNDTWKAQNLLSNQTDTYAYENVIKCVCVSVCGGVRGQWDVGKLVNWKSGKLRTEQRMRSYVRKCQTVAGLAVSLFARCKEYRACLTAINIQFNLRLMKRFN